MARVLVVDDSTSVRMDLGGAFAQAGFDVSLCGSLQEARRLLDLLPVDLVVLDLALPDGDGTELLAELKADPDRAGIPVIVHAAEAGIQDRVAGLERGADDYLGKPYEPHRVVRRGRELLGNRAPVHTRPTILVIDDSLTYRQALLEQLEVAGYGGLAAATGEEGLRRAAEYYPDALVVDGMLPGIDGASVVRRIRLDPVLQRIPCLFLTGSASGADEVAALDAGADAFVRKDQGIQAVLRRLAALLRSAEGTRVHLGPWTGAARRILLVARTPAVVDDVSRLLQDAGCDPVRAPDVSSALRLVSLQVPDMVVVEGLPEEGATADTCRQLRAVEPLASVPLVVLATSGAGDGLVPCLDAGADDWVALPSACLDALRARFWALLRRRDIEQREQRIQEELSARARRLAQANEELRVYRELIEKMPLGALVLEWSEGGDEAQPATVLVNPAMERACGFGAHELSDPKLRADLTQRAGGRLARTVVEARRQGETRKALDVLWNHPELGERTWNVQAVPLPARKVGIIVEDVSDLVEVRRERDRMERQMQAAQRLESVGRLAGGIAHDFNNLITVIGTYGTFVREALGDDHPSTPDVDAILDAAARAERLTGQLLAFSRKRASRTAPVSLDAVIRDLEPMLGRLIGRDVRLVLSLEPDLPDVLADPTQLEQVVVNLVTNARDAMPEGGRVEVATRHERPKEGEGLGEVVLTVRDTGTGMDEHTLAHVFEPFFTTKEPGRGTGLGLPTVYGIVRQFDGRIDVTSEVGRGTTFEIRFPAVEAGAAAPAPAVEEGLPRARGETVLLVEDEEAVREAARRILEGHGYRVVVARDFADALALGASGEPFDVLVTDIVMPGMKGPELARRLLEIRPELPVVFVSGYAGDALERAGESLRGAPVVQKPFSAASLIGPVHDVLAARRA